MFRNQADSKGQTLTVTTQLPYPYIHAFHTVFRAVYRTAFFLQQLGGDLRIEVVVLGQQDPCTAQALPVRRVSRAFRLRFLLGRNAAGNGHGKRGANTDFALHLHGAAHQPDQLFHDAHPDAAAFHLADGVECVDMLEKAANGTYQLILMDVQMPVMNGYDATKKIRRMDDPQKANIPIVAMTANAFSEDKQVALDAGMNDHIAKPINMSVLVPTLRKYL